MNLTDDLRRITKEAQYSHYPITEMIEECYNAAKCGETEMRFYPYILGVEDYPRDDDTLREQVRVVEEVAELLRQRGLVVKLFFEYVTEERFRYDYILIDWYEEK